MRYLPQTQNARAAMLAKIGAKSVEELYRDVPRQAFIDGMANIPMHKGEMEVEQILSGHANQNHAASAGPFFLGAGCYFHHIPASVDYIIQRSEFLTAYTPYQPEIAQGTLTAVFEFQTFIAQLTGQDVANASLYDGATALAEAALMAMRVTKRRNIVVANRIHPDYADVLGSYIGNYDDAAVAYHDGAADALNLDDNCACVIVQSPDFYGQPHKYAAYRKACDDAGALLIVVINEILSLGALPAPVEADIVCGEAQSIGLPMSFGGPHLGFFATRQKYVRQMPGRLIGQTTDAQGRRSFVLTLNTREQHIRREKATSNICTNQGLCALAFTVHMSLLGEDGFKHLAMLNHEKACQLADALEKIDAVSLVNDTFFNEITIQFSPSSTGHHINSQDLVDHLAEQGIIAGYPMENGQLILAATEMTSDKDIADLTQAIRTYLRQEG